MRPNLTPKQSKLYTIIVLGHENGKTPTLRQLGDELGVTRVTAYEHVAALIKKGYVRRSHRKSRSLVPIEPIEDRYITGRSDIERAVKDIGFQADKLLDKHDVPHEERLQLTLAIARLRQVARV